MALAAMIMPSSTECGSASMTLRSMNAPGSPSSPLHRMYLMSPWTRAQSSHLRPERKPAPPLPRSQDFFTSFTICSGVISVTAFDEMLLHEVRHVLGLHELVEDVLGVDHHHRAFGSEPVAPGQHELDLVLEVALDELRLKGVFNLQGPVCHASGSRANHDI